MRKTAQKDVMPVVTGWFLVCHRLGIRPKWRTLVAYLRLMGLLALPLAAQTVSITGGTFISHGMGFNPAPAISASILAGQRLAFHGGGYWTPADKYIGDGWTSGLHGCLTYRGFGGGLLVRHTETSQWTKTSLYPSVCAQAGWQRWSLFAMAHLRDPLTENHGRGGTVGVQYRIPMDRTWGVILSGEVTILRFWNADQFLTGFAVVHGVGLYRERVH